MESSKTGVQYKSKYHYWEQVEELWLGVSLVRAQSVIYLTINCAAAAVPPPIIETRQHAGSRLTCVIVTCGHKQSVDLHYSY